MNHSSLTQHLLIYQGIADSLVRGQQFLCNDLLDSLVIRHRVPTGIVLKYELPVTVKISFLYFFLNQSCPRCLLVSQWSFLDSKWAYPTAPVVTAIADHRGRVC